ncbi:hypothetical protein ACFYM5_01550 [Streptomyces sp. NPDC006706]
MTRLRESGDRHPCRPATAASGQLGVGDEEALAAVRHALASLGTT